MLTVVYLLALAAYARLAFGVVMGFAFLFMDTPNRTIPIVVCGLVVLLFIVGAILGTMALF